MPRTKLEAQEEFLQALEPQLSELKEVSLALGSALEAQNHHLDRIDTKIDRVKDDMTQVSAQARRVAAGKMHVNYRFRCAIQCINTGKFLQDVNGEPMLSADVVLDGCSFRAYTLGDGTDTWGFQSEKTSLFLGVNRFGYLKVKGSDFHSYEQFALDVGKAKTALFCYASFFGLGGWVTQLGNGKLNVIRGTPENKASAAFFKVVNLDAIADALKSER
ncbi:TPA: hypothetical protein N0F65_010015 [Lagenidium giganteum]|uniref:t-SNARE coiled-coil homology domain-containing protein n=1 Tax=Lagenidium giganteum TaxID=4803 RepID=A0AAV2ZEV5_9STRA|nr:TPA: hypothetical protein N0F65_010015 [Lagenidium giganteum]